VTALAGEGTRRCWLSIGSNLDREQSIRGGVRDLRAAYGELTLSPVYETVAVGFSGAPFLNLVAGIDTDESVGAINARLRAIEDGHGRLRGPDKFAPRTLDIDLLTWGEAVGTIDGYELPRDEILKYAFVLGPLAEVAPQARHPLSGRRYADLWRELGEQMQRDGGALRPYPLPL
jgi:2-amino-4-hydroxy-6-hydroxymethyldihydropteridine diphosphokinase